MLPVSQDAALAEPTFREVAENRSSYRLAADLVVSLRHLSDLLFLQLKKQRRGFRFAGLRD
jgi:hypothetical protein